MTAYSEMDRAFTQLQKAADPNTYRLEEALGFHSLTYISPSGIERVVKAPCQIKEMTAHLRLLTNILEQGEL